MSLGPIAGIAGKIKTLIALFPTDNLTKVNRIDVTLSTRAADSTVAKQAELVAAKAVIDLNLDGKVSEIKSRLTSVKLIASNAAWSVPAGVSVVYVTAIGGGGGGGSSGITASNASGSAGATGGNGGESCHRIPLNVVGVSALNIVVGSGGSGGVAPSVASTFSANGAVGGDGTATIVGPIQVLGGLGGNYSGSFSGSANGTTPNAPVAHLGCGLYCDSTPAGGGGDGDYTGGPSSDGWSGTSVFGHTCGVGGNRYTGGVSGGGGGGGGCSFLANGGNGGNGGNGTGGNGVAGAANTGTGGGGGGGCDDSNGAGRTGGAGGNGGSGVVILEY